MGGVGIAKRRLAVDASSGPADRRFAANVSACVVCVDAFDQRRTARAGTNMMNRSAAWLVGFAVAMSGLGGSNVAFADEPAKSEPAKSEPAKPAVESATGSAGEAVTADRPAEEKLKTTPVSASAADAANATKPAPESGDKTSGDKTSGEKTSGDKTSGDKAASGGKAGSALSQQLQAAARQLANSQSHTFVYRASAGETLRWKVTHLVTVDTKIRGSEQSAKTRSASTKSWRVTSVDDAGNITFVYSVDDVDMWQSVTGRQEIRYNSRTDATPPREYELASKSVGVPLATVTIDRFGRVLKRDSEQAQFNPGLGELTIPFPEKEMKVGARWNVPDEIRIRLEDGRVQRVQTRQAYTLEKVETGVATIGIKTEVLTPIDDPKVHAQLVQRLTQGTVKFDLEAGRLLSRQMDLDETVIGFSGPDSVMQYLARLTDELQPASAAGPER